MEIYVRSRGFSQEDGYFWLPETPEIIRENQVNELIQSEVFSLVIGRYSNKFLLLITGLEASERKDFRDRTIRNSVAWVGEDSPENEQKIRAIAAAALQDELRENLRAEIDESVVFDEEHGFKLGADISKLSVEEVITIHDSPPAKEERRIGKDSQILREKLAYELETRCLPKGDSFDNLPLVVVTGIQSEDTLIQAGVWRGLSTSVKSEVWQEYKKSPSYLETLPENNQASQKNNTLTLIIVFILGILVFTILLLWLFYPKPQSN
ncbi:MAG: hypothetical protein KME23_13390 [Goleter apudmare HA4340-LM2]|jgi:hypothetical protein|nr:hypothetical protein [Goleter apudmare HA4340-LM2]